MKKSKIYKLLAASNLLLIFTSVTINKNLNENQVLILEKNNEFTLGDSKNANEIIVQNPDVLKNWNFSQIRDLLETTPMTQNILNQLSIQMPSSLDPSLVTFTNINNNISRVTFTINYNGIPKTTNDFLNITPTDEEVVNSIIIENHDILISRDNLFIKSLLETNPMTQDVLNQLSVRIPEIIDVSKISFVEINIDNPVRITFKIKYNNTIKDSIEFLNSAATDKEIANKIFVLDNDILLDKNVLEIRTLLESAPMTQDVLNQLSITIPEGINVSRISFKKIDISDPFKVTFEINYNNVPKDSIDFLNATLTDKQTVESTIIGDNSILSDLNINNIKALLETNPMTQDILNQLSITLPKGASPEKITFTEIDTSNPFQINFRINYNGVPKDSMDFLYATPTDKEVANSSIIINPDVLIDQNVSYIRNLLETSLITQDILNQLSIQIPEGSTPSKFSFTNIDTSNLYRVTFQINYNNVPKDVLVSLNATPKDQEVALETKVLNPDILVSQNISYIRNLLETPLMTQDILNQLSIQIPEGSTPSKFSFTNINVENPFYITFTINYNGVSKLTNDFLNATPTNQEIVNTLFVAQNDKLINNKVAEIKNILETKPLTNEILDQLSIKIYDGILVNRITFTNINIENPLKITFTINYNGVPKDPMDFFYASATDSEIVNSLVVQDANSLQNLSSMEIRNLLETSPMNQGILEQISIKLHDGIDVTKISFTQIDISNPFKVTFRINYNGVLKEDENFLNSLPSDQEIANKILVDNPNILIEENNEFVEALLLTNPMTQSVLDQLSIIIFPGVDPSKISFSDIDTSNPLRITFTINYNGVKKLIPDFLNTTQNDQEIVNAITVNNIDAVKNLTVIEIRNLLEKKPLTFEILNQLSISVPEGAQISKISFTNINISNLFQVTFTINYNNASKVENGILNATPTEQDVLKAIRINNLDILLNENRENIKTLLQTSPMTQEVLDRISLVLPLGVDPSQISFTEIDTSNPFKVAFIINYKGVPKETPNWLNTNPTDLEVVDVISVMDVDILKIENNSYIKKLLEGNQTLETLSELSINFPEGADITKISFTNINIDDPLKITFTINYNDVPKSTIDFLNSTPSEDIANAVIITNQDILKTKNVSYIENLIKTNPMTIEILNELSITLPENIPANRITFTNIDTSNLYQISFTINYNGVLKETTDFLNATPTNQDIANAIVINDFDIFIEKDIHYVKELLETNPMTQEMLDQLSIILPPNIDPSKVSFTNINIDDLSKITFNISYDGVASTQSLFFNVMVVARSSNTILIVSILVPGSLIIVAIIGFYFWNKKKINSNTNNNNNNNEPKIESNNEPKIESNNEPKIENKNSYNNNNNENQSNNEWYSEYSEYGYSDSYNDSNISDQSQNNNQWYDQQNQNPNHNGQYPNDLNNNEEQWVDNRWYSSQAETGQWSNGDWFDYENEKSNPNSSSNSSLDSTQDDWDELLKKIE